MRSICSEIFILTVKPCWNLCPFSTLFAIFYIISFSSYTTWPIWHNIGVRQSFLHISPKPLGLAKLFVRQLLERVIALERKKMTFFLNFQPISWKLWYKERNLNCWSARYRSYQSLLDSKLLDNSFLNLLKDKLEQSEPLVFLRPI